MKVIGAGVGTTALAGCTGGSGGDGEIGLVLPHFGAWDTSIAYIIGNEEGFFEDEGLEVSRVDVEGGGGNVRTVASGDAQIGLGTGIMSLLAAYNEGSPIKIVSNHINSASELTWYTHSDSEYDELADLTDADIAYSSEGSSTHLVASQAISHGELDNASAVSVGGPPDANAALEGGDIDVAWTTPPSFYDSIESGEYKTVFMGSDIPPLDEFTVRGNFADQNWLEQNGDQAEAFFRAYNDSLEWAYNNLDATIEYWYDARDGDHDQELLQQIVEDLFPQEILDLHEFKGIDQNNEFAVEFGFYDEPIPEDEIDELIDTSYLPDN